MRNLFCKKNEGALTFNCSDEYLNEGFKWAKNLALSYANKNDPVGLWCESALPGRNAFCMRDVSHQVNGAFALGLSAYSKNMLMRFAQSIAESRKFCCFWEINRLYRPAPVDYKSDNDFWYNLPANFDVLDACYRMYLLTGDRDFIFSEDFNRFYDLTVTKYIEAWDKDGDGIPERAELNTHMGIPSYEEAEARDAKIIIDLICAQARGFRSYAEIQKIKGDLSAYETYMKKYEHLISVINDEWYSAQKGTYKYAELFDGSDLYLSFPREYPGYFGVINSKDRLEKYLDDLNAYGEKGILVEVMSHLPEIFFKNGDKQRGVYWLKKLVDPKLKRRKYPEVSYSAAGNYIFGIMGLKANFSTKTVSCAKELPEGIDFAEAKNIPLFGGSIDIKISGSNAEIINNTGYEINTNL